MNSGVVKMISLSVFLDIYQLANQILTGYSRIECSAASNQLFTRRASIEKRSAVTIAAEASTCIGLNRKFSVWGMIALGTGRSRADPDRRKSSPNTFVTRGVVSHPDSISGAGATET